jgi:predicted PurR-regulated permease PerM
LLLELPPRPLEKIEVMNKKYVVLKTTLSALTGFLVAALLGLLGVRLWFVWG